MRAAGRSLKSAKVVPAKSVDEAMGMMKAETAHAFALTHDALPTLQKELPGSRILDGAFQTVGVAIAVQKERPAALAYVKEFMDKAKADGTVRRAFDDAGIEPAGRRALAPIRLCFRTAAALASGAWGRKPLPHPAVGGSL